MSKSKRIVGPFTSEYGTFNPGDSAIAITVCTGNVHVARVEYVGYVERQIYNWQTKQTRTEKYAQIRRPSQRGEWYDKATNEACRWTAGAVLGYRYIPTTTVTTLQYNRLLPASASIDNLIKAI